MTHSEQLTDLAKALSKFQGEVGSIPKTAENPFFKSKYADLATVKAVAEPVAAKHGLSVTQLPGYSDNTDTLTTILLHESGQFIEETMQLRLTKQDAQGQGSAMTYARRYSYMSVLGLVADVDDDGNAAASRPKAQAVQRTTKADDRVYPPAPEPPARDIHQDVTPITNEQISELMQLAKRKGMKTKEEATAFLDGLHKGPFTKVTQEDYETFKKTVISSGWKQLMEED